METFWNTWNNIANKIDKPYKVDIDNELLI